MTPYTFAGMLLPEWFQHIKHRTPTTALAEQFVAEQAGAGLLNMLSSDTDLTPIQFMEQTGLHLLQDADTLQHDRDVALNRSLSEIE